MKIKSITLKNFRGYNRETTISFDNLTAFVGRNDIGKSTILEALDIFFNDGKGIVKMDKSDLNVEAKKHGDTEISITVRFDDLPGSIVIDSACETTFSSEYLLNPDGLLEITKRYPNGGNAKVFIRAQHPTNPACAALLQKKDSELRTIIEGADIVCNDRSNNPSMRAAIWQHYANDLRLSTVEIEVTKSNTKSIWERLQNYLPIYSLFQADRKNSDGDSEVQDPLREAVKAILQNGELRKKLDEVAEAVVNELQDVSGRTLQKLKIMSPDTAQTLTPVIPDASSLKWADVFKSVAITSDDNIPVNKRGSGVKRMILLSFFQAEVERRRSIDSSNSIIYAIEEPETAQHYASQKKLVSALLELADTTNTQVILTTHSATIVKSLEFDIIRLIRMVQEKPVIENVPPCLLPYPSLNEVNYLAFDEITTEYFDELYGHIMEQHWFNAYKQGKTCVQYNQLQNDGTLKLKQMIKTEYIRHQIHHPENKNNPWFNDQELHDAIIEMRDFIQVQTATSAGQ